jgi:outer membrane protein assembly factor BamD
MRHKIQCIFISVILCYSYGCAPKSAKIQQSVVPPDKTLFETGSTYLKRGQPLKARLALQTLINTYPESELVPDAVLTMADTYYVEGGTDSLLQAEDGYGNFIIFYPHSSKADLALLKIISLNERLMRGPQNDQHYSYKTLKEIVRFEKQFSESDYLPIVKKLKIRVQEVLAQQDYLIGKFYEDDKRNLPAAFSRYQEIPEKYGNYSEMDNVYFLMANILEKFQNPNEAAKYYGKIAEGYPFSKVFDDAKARLKFLGKEVPSVDQERAGDNLTKVKPSTGFAPWKPLIDTFKPHPDVYKKAIEEIAATREDKTAEPKPGEGSQPTKSGEITRTITNDSNGEPSPKASNLDSAPDSPNNGADKNTSTSRYRKKTTSSNNGADKNNSTKKTAK